MKQFDKWFFPDHEAHLQQWMQNVNRRVDGRLTYQYGKYEGALEHCKARRAAIDVGAHIGLWSYFMARDFNKLYAFEPCAEHRKCWQQNMGGTDAPKRPVATFAGAPVLFPFALGGHEDLVRVETRTQDSSGDTGIVPGVGKIEMKTLDSFNLNDVDFIKIDCEGYEANVLEGAQATLLRCKPCVIVEQKRDMAVQYGLKQLQAVDMLKALGAKLRAETSGDYILSWD